MTGHLGSPGKFGTTLKNSCRFRGKRREIQKVGIDSKPKQNFEPLEFF